MQQNLPWNTDILHLDISFPYQFIQYHSLAVAAGMQYVAVAAASVVAAVDEVSEVVATAFGVAVDGFFVQGAV